MICSGKSPLSMLKAGLSRSYNAMDEKTSLSRQIMYLGIEAVYETPIGNFRPSWTMFCGFG